MKKSITAMNIDIKYFYLNSSCITFDNAVMFSNVQPITIDSPRR